MNFIYQNELRDSQISVCRGVLILPYKNGYLSTVCCDIALTKKETWRLADQLGAFDYIRQHTHTCYLGVEGGCHTCPSCLLREKGLNEYLAERGEKHV